MCMHMHDEKRRAGDKGEEAAMYRRAGLPPMQMHAAENAAGGRCGCSECRGRKIHEGGGSLQETGLENWLLHMPVAVVVGNLTRV